MKLHFLESLNGSKSYKVLGGCSENIEFMTVLCNLSIVCIMENIEDVYCIHKEKEGCLFYVRNKERKEVSRKKSKATNR